MRFDLLAIFALAGVALASNEGTVHHDVPPPWLVGWFFFC
jgi:hypothetical protein